MHVSNIIILKLLISKEICLNNKIFYQHIKLQVQSATNNVQHNQNSHSLQIYSTLILHTIVIILHSTVLHTLRHFQKLGRKATKSCDDLFFSFSLFLTILCILTAEKFHIASHHPYLFQVLNIKLLTHIQLNKCA